MIGLVSLVGDHRGFTKVSMLGGRQNFPKFTRCQSVEKTRVKVVGESHYLVSM
jgi:hypothetical protein